MQKSEAVQNLPIFGRKSEANECVMTGSREAALIWRVRQGDEDAFAELYGLYAPTINAVVLARVPRDDVQDIVQEVFLSAYRKLETLRDVSLFGPWLVRIGRNEAVNFYRSRKLCEELPEDLPHRRDKKSEAAEVLRTIRSLSDRYSETLIMRLVEGMSAKEIAERTGLKPESVRVNLHRGMELLRQRLGIKVETK